jgi:hypothetical protein
MTLTLICVALCVQPGLLGSLFFCDHKFTHVTHILTPPLTPVHLCKKLSFYLGRQDKQFYAFNNIHSVHCTYNHLYTRTYVHVSVINHHPQGNIHTKECIILIHQFYKYNVNNSYKYNNMDIMASIMLTYYWLKFTDMSLFTMFVVPCSNILMNETNYIQ